MRRTQGFGAAMLGGMALGGLLATTVLCATSAPARADSVVANDTLDLSGFERVTDDSLGGLRGGFRVGNVDVNFGVTMQTAVNGQQVLQTVFNPTDGSSSTAANGWSGTAGANGFTVTSPDGHTVIQHDIGQSITTNIANSADNRTIQNTTTLDVFFNNLPAVQAEAAAAHALTTMVGDMNSHIVMGN